MIANAATAEKRTAVDQLDFGSMTARRVSWEAWEFAVVGPHRVEVTNASYGCEKVDHQYVVTVVEQSGTVVPVECECPADVRRHPDCKHKVALACVGGQAVLRAAVERAAAPSSSSDAERTTADELLHSDGGTVEESRTDLIETESCPNGNPRCPGPEGDGLPCFDCYEGGDNRGDAR